MSGTVPIRVKDIVRQWRAEGSPPQMPMEWPRDRWVAEFPAHAEALRALPDAVDRVTVRGACAASATDAYSAEQAFIVVMAWGYGKDVGYGPWRTKRVLTQTPDAAERLASVARTLAEQGAISAYGRLATKGDCNLRWLGPAFGTKVLYFCQPAGSEAQALILDNLVATWLRREAGVDLDPVPWSVPNYAQYLGHMHQWSSDLGCSADDLEYCIFRSIATESSSQWGAIGSKDES